MIKSYLIILIICSLISPKSFSQNHEKVRSDSEFAIIEFEETEFDFGNIEEGEKITHVFKFRNISEIPLLITRAAGSCGCTIPYFPKDSIYPGEQSEIELEFNSKGKIGKQNKRVVIVANTNPSNIYLYLKGQVIESDSDNKEEEELRIASQEKLKALNPDCFAIYPNPTSDILRIELKEYIGKSALIMIYSEMGDKVLEERVNKISSQSTSFNVSDFQPGIYFASIIVEGNVPMTQCFIVAK